MIRGGDDDSSGGWGDRSNGDTLARSLGPHYSRAGDEAHGLLSEAFNAPSADLQIVGDELNVSLEAALAPRCTSQDGGQCHPRGA